MRRRTPRRHRRARTAAPTLGGRRQPRSVALSPRLAAAAARQGALASGCACLRVCVCAEPPPRAAPTARRPREQRGGRGGAGRRARPGLPEWRGRPRLCRSSAARPERGGRAADGPRGPAQPRCSPEGSGAPRGRRSGAGAPAGGRRAMGRRARGSIRPPLGLLLGRALAVNALPC